MHQNASARIQKSKLGLSVEEILSLRAASMFIRNLQGLGTHTPNCSPWTFPEEIPCLSIYTCYPIFIAELSIDYISEEIPINLPVITLSCCSPFSAPPPPFFQNHEMKYCALMPANLYT